MKSESNKLGIIMAGLAIATGIILTLFRCWEASGETWGYWLFARIFSETGDFIITGRSPVYILYVNIFRGLGYPGSIILEYIVTSSIVALCLIALFRRYIGLGWAVFAVLLWIPFFQVAEPPVQSLALACVCLAIVARDRKATRFRLAVSYSLLVLAYMFRTPYVIFLLLFGFWDIFKIIKQKGPKSFLAKLRPRRTDWPILPVLILLVWVNLAQSPHPWNNGWFATTKWFPSDGKTLANASFVQSYNWHYIYYKYGTYKDKDFYSTNQEAFSGANDMLGIIRANPRFVATQFTRHLKKTFCTVASFTMLPGIFYKKLPWLGYFHYLILLFFTIPFLLAILYGALRASKNKVMFLFIIGCVLIILANAIIVAKARYMQPLIPILILASFWYGKKVRDYFRRRIASKYSGNRALPVFNCLVIAFSFIFFSSGLNSWTRIIKDLSADISKGEVRIMERRPYSLKASFESLKPLIDGCQGMMSLEHKFLGAFSDIPLNKIYDVWEIPPFGSLGESAYQGLGPDRIDCLLISHKLSKDLGSATNFQIRYENYIEPYMRYLESIGAKIYDIEGYGQAIILAH